MTKLASIKGLMFLFSRLPEPTKDLPRYSQARQADVPHTLVCLSEAVQASQTLNKCAQACLMEKKLIYPQGFNKLQRIMSRVQISSFGHDLIV